MARAVRPLFIVDASIGHSRASTTKFGALSHHTCAQAHKRSWTHVPRAPSWCACTRVCVVSHACAARPFCERHFISSTASNECCINKLPVKMDGGGRPSSSHVLCLTSVLVESELSVFARRRLSQAAPGEHSRSLPPLQGAQHRGSRAEPADGGREATAGQDATASTGVHGRRSRRGSSRARRASVAQHGAPTTPTAARRQQPVQSETRQRARSGFRRSRNRAMLRFHLHQAPGVFRVRLQFQLLQRARMTTASLPRASLRVVHSWQVELEVREVRS